MKTYNPRFIYNLWRTIVLLFIVGYFLTGCATQHEPEIKVVYKTKIVKVPVACITEPVTCSFSGSGFKPTVYLLDCVILQKKIIDRCSNVE